MSGLLPKLLQNTLFISNVYPSGLATCMEPYIYIYFIFLHFYHFSLTSRPFYPNASMSQPLVFDLITFGLRPPFYPPSQPFYPSSLISLPFGFNLATYFIFDPSVLCLQCFYISYVCDAYLAMFSNNFRGPVSAYHL